jgi:hypothetical protein
MTAAAQSFAFRSDAAVEVRYVGQEQEPVVIVDGASGYAAALVGLAACQSRFEPAAALGGAYPGLLGTAPTAYVDAMVRFVLPLIAGHFRTGMVVPVRARGNFSLVTTPVEALEPDQRLPHVDAADPLQFAAIHYLARDNPDGTGFFRHRATGFETLDVERAPIFRASLDAELSRLDMKGYPMAEHGPFDQIGAVEARQDRFIVYRASLFHSGLISAVPTHAADPRRGRLTGNLFLQCRTPD